MNKHSHRLVFSRSLGLCIAVAETVTAAGKSASGERRRSGASTAIGIGMAIAALAAQAQGLPGGAALTGIAPRAGLANASTANASTASTLPTGGNIVKGAGSISVSGADMTVNQSTQRLVTDWQSFSIGAGNSVRFIQPSSSSVALNRVIGDNASTIFGSLTANGHVYLENANGVYFAPGAQVSVGGFLATTLQVDADQFMQGKLRLSGGSEASGTVDNAGSIVTSAGGSVVLAGPVVMNSGSITTPGGTTALVAGNAVTIDPTGSGLLSISVPVSAVNARLVQTGAITADGGAVQLAAAATDAALRTVMQVDGVIRARSIENHGGQILLSGGTSGNVLVSGELDVSGSAGAQGGTIKVLGSAVGLIGQARLDASGASGGGTVLVGGNRQGHGPEQNANNTYVGSGVVLDASATTKGDGGTVVVWADNTTSYAGQINARGGTQGGDGGQAEVSGKQTLNFAGGSDLSAPKGKTGGLLLDPSSITIGTTADLDGNGVFGDDVTSAGIGSNDFTPTTNSLITAATVGSLLATNSLSLAATNTITVNSAVTVAPGGSSTTLTLGAGNININAAMTLNNASLTTDSSSILIAGAVSSSKAISLTANFITIDSPLSASTMSLLNNTTDNRNIAQSATGVVSAGSLTIGGAVGNPGWDDVDLSRADNKIGTLDITSSSAELRVVNAAGVPLVLSGTLDSLDLSLVNTTVNQNAGVAGALTIGNGQAGLVNLTTTGPNAVNLTNPNNAFTGFGGISFAVGGDINVNATGDLLAQGSAVGDVTMNATGRFLLANSISGRNVDITGVGFVDSGNGAIGVGSGGRFFIRSSDFTQDDFSGPLSFGAGAGQINYNVFAGYSGADPSSGNGFYTNRTGTITPPVTDNAPVSKVYDGSPNFAYSQTGAAAVGRLAGARVGFALTSYSVTSSGTFSDKNAGTDKGSTVAASNDTSGTEAGGVVDYGLQFASFTRAPGPHSPGTPGNDISQITPKAITSTGVDGVDRVYNGTRLVGIDVGAASLVGTIAGDTVGLSAAGATGTLVDKNVGVNKPVVVAGLTLTGADAGNYTVTDASAANATISQLGITSHGIVGVNRSYDGTTFVSVNGAGATLAGVVSGDTVGVVTSSATGSVANKNVGAGKPVTVVGVGLSGVDAGNYAVSDASGATVAITPKAITATGIDGVDRVYNGTTVVGLTTAGAGLAGTISGDTVALVATGATGSITDKNVGVDKPVTVGGLTLSGIDAGNYTVTGATGATATITQKTIGSSGFTGIDRVYDGTTTVAVNGSGATLTGVIGGDTVTVNPVGTTGSVANKNAGAGKAVSIGSVALGGADAGNYAVTDASGATVSIVPRPITSTGVAGVDRTYDGTTAVAVDAGGASLNNTIAGDSISIVATSATGTMADKNAGAGKAVTVTGLGLGGSDAANYGLTDASNATVNIAKLVLSSTGITATDRVFNGGTSVALNTSDASLVGVLAGDTVGVNASGAVGSVSTPDPGAGKAVTVTGIALTGPDAIDYAVSPTPITSSGGGLTVRILTTNEGRFDDLRFKEYLQAVSDAQEPFRRAMLEALLSGFGKENIRKQLQRGLVFETGLAPPAVDIIEPAKAPEPCTPAAGANLSCGR